VNKIRPVFNKAAKPPTKQSYLERAIRAQLLVIYGIGCLYIAQLSGVVNLTVQGIEISPSQAEAIQIQPPYFTDNQSGIRSKKR